MKDNYNVNLILTKCKYIKNIFSKNTRSGGNSMTHRWMLLLMRGTCEVIGGAGYSNGQMEVVA